MDDATLTIGEVARRAGVKTSAIRYYERVGVLPEPDRLAGQRRYTAETVRRLQVVDVAKRAGFSLDEVRELLDSDRASDSLRMLAQRKLPDVQALIERATAMQSWLTTATGCDCPTLDVCDLFGPDAERPEGSDRAAFLPLTHVG
ncbi:MerR family transcriptional regulator [Conexibacter sp. CPCC 206217]|uniref:MerR family transcriptional regulator n=1 Tax=Conexibacter sp. CPCC 206217 TaxID=3064574 RepID=UPI00272574AC|nr:MerR family transcriptional regulator [Conexibacter sp. CPCC 206217]MDO8213192.1 MerR family transcriptional regulator [Conexibacter sp. CPCC 206217]